MQINLYTVIFKRNPRFETLPATRHFSLSNCNEKFFSTVFQSDGDRGMGARHADMTVLKPAGVLAMGAGFCPEGPARPRASRSLQRKPAKKRGRSIVPAPKLDVFCSPCAPRKGQSEMVYGLLPLKMSTIWPTRGSTRSKGWLSLLMRTTSATIFMPRPRA